MDRIKYDESLEEAAMRIIVQPLLEEQLTEFEDLSEKSQIFSERLERNLARVFRRDILRQRIKTAALWGRRVAVCLMVVLTFALVACAAVEPLREKLANAFLTWYEECVDIKFEIDETEEATIKVLTKAPEGYELIDTYDENGFLDMVYQNADGNLLFFSRSPYHDNVSIKHSEEYRFVEKVDINGVEGLHFYTEDNNSHILSWLDGKYLYDIIADVPYDLLMESALSVK